MLTEQEAAQIKERLIKHIEETYPEDKKHWAIGQIQAMSIPQLEELLKKNKLVGENTLSSETSQCIFCAIAQNQVQSYKILEQEDAVAVLEINPVSKGHTIIIPKTHLIETQIPENLFTLAKSLAGHLKKQLGADSTEILINANFGHAIINIIPIYERPFDFPRQKAENQELENLRELLAVKPAPKEPIAKDSEPKFIKEDYIPRRLP